MCRGDGGVALGGELFDFVPVVGLGLGLDQIDEVNKVLKEIAADKIHQVLIWNKIDLSGHEPAIERDEHGRIARIFVSAKTGAGMDLLREALVELASAHKPDWQKQQEQQQKDEWTEDPRFRGI